MAEIKNTCDSLSHDTANMRHNGPHKHSVLQEQNKPTHEKEFRDSRLAVVFHFSLIRYSCNVRTEPTIQRQAVKIAANTAVQSTPEF